MIINISISFLKALDLDLSPYLEHTYICILSWLYESSPELNIPYPQIVFNNQWCGAENISFGSDSGSEEPQIQIAAMVLAPALATIF